MTEVIELDLFYCHVYQHHLSRMVRDLLVLHRRKKPYYFSCSQFAVAHMKIIIIERLLDIAGKPLRGKLRVNLFDYLLEHISKIRFADYSLGNLLVYLHLPVAFCLLVRQFRYRRPQVRKHIVAKREAWQIALEYVAVVLFLFLASQRTCDISVRVPRSRLACDSTVAADCILLPYYFIAERPLDFLEACNIFYLHSNRTDGYVCIHSHRSLNVRVIHSKVLQYTGELL